MEFVHGRASGSKAADPDPAGPAAHEGREAGTFPPAARASGAHQARTIRRLPPGAGRAPRTKW
eukprot:3636696-Heterocapsa_arctica.AAC.1